MNESDTGFEIRPLTERCQIEELLIHRWIEGSLVILGKTVRPADVEALAAYRDGRLAGIATWHMRDGFLYLLTLNNITSHHGIGVALFDGMVALARERGFRILRTMIGNDNVDALRFYQRRGFRLIALYAGSVDRSRLIKPSIPRVGAHGIPFRDELELELEI